MKRVYSLLLVLLVPFILELFPLIFESNIRFVSNEISFKPLNNGRYFNESISNATALPNNVSLLTGLSVFVENNSNFLKGIASFIVSFAIIIAGLYYLRKLEYD